MKKPPLLTDEYLDQMVQKAKKQADADFEKSKKFFNSPRFEDIIFKLRLEVEKAPVADNTWEDGFLFSDVTNNEFLDVFIALSHPEISGLTPMIENEGEWESDIVIFKDIEFSMMYGQGAMLIASKYEK